MDDRELEALLAELRREKQAASAEEESLYEDDELPDDDTNDAEIEDFLRDWDDTDEPDSDDEIESEIRKSWNAPSYEEIEQNEREPEPMQAVEQISEKPALLTDRSLRSRLRSMMEADITPPSQTFDSAEMTNQRLQHRYTVLGAILVVFAMIGVVSTVLFAVKHFRPEKPNVVYQTEVAEAVMPLVVMDCPMFQSAAELSDELMLTAGIWSILTHDGLSKYTEELGLCNVPATDVDAEMRRLFFLSDAEMPQHQTIGATNDLRCYYDAEDNSYRIPTDILHFSYIPQVTKLEQDEQTGEDFWCAEVAYLPDLPAWQRDDDTEPSPSKIVKITLARENKTDSAPIWQVAKMEQIS